MMRALHIALLCLCVVSSAFAADLKSLKEGAALLDAPKGKAIGKLSAGASVQELRTQGDAAFVLVEGWIKKSAVVKVPPLLARVRTLAPSSDNVDFVAKPGGKSIGRLDKTAQPEMRNIESGWLKVALSGWVSASALGAPKEEPKEQPKEATPPVTDTSAAPPAPAGPNPRVRLSTTEGDIVIELDQAKAPKTVANFLSYVEKGYYEGTIFHRVMENFMIQGGGFDVQYNQKPTNPPIPIESNNGLKNFRGTVAMARTADPNSATSQFFINVVDNALLDYPGRDGFGYTVFARVVSGMETADKIRKIPTGNPAAPPPLQREAPQTMVVINKATIEK